MTGNSESGTTQCTDDGRVIHCTSVADIGLPYARGGGRVSQYRPIFGPRQRIARIGTYRVS